MQQLTSRRALALALFVAGLIGIGCTGGIKPGARPLGQTAFKVTSGEYVSEYKNNPGAAQSKYGDKTIELTGKLVAIGNDHESQPYLYLEGPNPADLERASCQMAGRLPWSKASPGQTVTVKGRADPVIPVARLLNCEIVSVAGEPAPRLTADEFAQRAAGGNIARKEGQNYFVVRGEIERIDPNNSGLFLKTQVPKTRVLIHFGPEEYKRLNVANWQPGQQIEVIGMDSSNPGAGWLVNCLPME